MPGYCDPPLHSRIKPGEVRNPKGKPKGAFSLTKRLRKKFAEDPDGIGEEIVAATIEAAKNGTAADRNLLFTLVDGPITQKIDLQITGDKIVTELFTILAERGYDVDEIGQALRSRLSDQFRENVYEEAEEVV